MLRRKRAYVVPVPLPLPPFPSDRVPGLHFCDLDRKRDALDAELHGGAEHLLCAFGPVQKQWFGPTLQAERADQSDDAEEMIGVKVSEEDLGEREAHAVAHHLALRAFAAFEEERFPFPVNGQPGNVALDGGPSRTGA